MQSFKRLLKYGKFSICINIHVCVRVCVITGFGPTTLPAKIQLPALDFIHYFFLAVFVKIFSLLYLLSKLFNSSFGMQGPRCRSPFLLTPIELNNQMQARDRYKNRVCLCLSVCLSACQFICFSVCLIVCLFACLFVCLSVYLFVHVC